MASSPKEYELRVYYFTNNLDQSILCERAIAEVRKQKHVEIGRIMESSIYRASSYSFVTVTMPPEEFEKLDFSGDQWTHAASGRQLVRVMEKGMRKGVIRVSIEHLVRA